MGAKGPEELTGDEYRLLVIASKLFAALRERAERPPPQSDNKYWADKLVAELVRHICIPPFPSSYDYQGCY